MDKIKAWFDEYTVQIEAIIMTIYNFIKAIFEKETEGEFDNLGI